MVQYVFADALYFAHSFILCYSTIFCMPFGENTEIFQFPNHTRSQ